MKFLEMLKKNWIGGMIGFLYFPTIFVGITQNGFAGDWLKYLNPIEIITRFFSMLPTLLTKAPGILTLYAIGLFIGVWVQSKVFKK